MADNTREELRDAVYDILQNDLDPRIDEGQAYFNGQEEAWESIEQLIQSEITKAVEAARANDPLTCEFGHEIYAHKSADGWCCACEADQAFMQAEITKAQEQLLDELDAVAIAPSCKENCTDAEHAYHEGSYDLAGKIDNWAETKRKRLNGSKEA